MARRLSVFSILLALTLLVATACASANLTAAGEKVRVVDDQQLLTACRKIKTITVSAESITKSEEAKLRENIARNRAAKRGGNAIIAVGETTSGGGVKQEYEIFYCPTGLDYTARQPSPPAAPPRPATEATTPQPSPAVSPPPPARETNTTVISKHDAAMANLSILGEFTVGEKNIIVNTLQSSLSQSYKLVTEETYRKAEREAFQSLDVDQCTEENCIRKIQEYLQIERLILLQIIKEKEIFQVSITIARSEDMIIRSDTCRACDLDTLNRKVVSLVSAAVAADLNQ